MSDGALIARETAISAVINGVLSLLFFLIVFGVASPVTLGALAFDGLPQTFMVAFMGSIVPGLIIASKQARAKRPVILRAVGIGLVCLIVLGGGGWLLLHAKTASYPPLPVLLGKIAYGAILGAIVTPFAVHRVLRQEVIA